MFGENDIQSKLSFALVNEGAGVFVWPGSELKDVFKADTSIVCSIHFSENDYERNLQSELTGIERK
ncbi:hypothetical protein PR048_004592 [Dryococelus australis]|uniref:Uncharacterized protein n=1 Tax=Dryococelus australis TaxID=614101 RepID=A0ABQ9I6A1_9NEOP|nr:hypothetical protein PR048_004592 [Dryococelus australis]